MFKVYNEEGLLIADNLETIMELLEELGYKIIIEEKDCLIISMKKRAKK